MGVLVLVLMGVFVFALVGLSKRGSLFHSMTLVYFVLAIGLHILFWSWPEEEGRPSVFQTGLAFAYAIFGVAGVLTILSGLLRRHVARFRSTEVFLPRFADCVFLQLAMISAVIVCLLFYGE